MENWWKLIFHAQKERERIKYPTVCGHGLNSKSEEPFGWASSVIHSSAVAVLTTWAPLRWLMDGSKMLGKDERALNWNCGWVFVGELS